MSESEEINLFDPFAKCSGSTRGAGIKEEEEDSRDEYADEEITTDSGQGTLLN